MPSKSEAETKPDKRIRGLVFAALLAGFIGGWDASSSFFIFLSFFALTFGNESKVRKDALDKIQEVISKAVSYTHLTLPTKA